MHTVAAARVGADVLTRAWNLAYAGYFVDVSRDVAGVLAHVREHSVDLDRSLVAFDGDAPVGLSLLGVRPGARGWVGGFGIAPSHRGRGLAGDLLADQLDVARRSGLVTVDLEVLTQNWAQRVYARAGFEVVRRLLVLSGRLRRDRESWPADLRPDPVDRQAVSWSTGSAGEAVLRAATAIAGHAAPWNRDAAYVPVDDAVQVAHVGRAEAPDAVLAVRVAGAVGVVGAVARDATSGAAVVAALAQRHEGAACRVVNEPEGSQLVAAFRAVGLAEVMAQVEMRVALSRGHAST